jgi:cation:H+ antiporter
VTYRHIILQDGLFLLIAELMLLIAMYYSGVSFTMSAFLIVVYLLYVVYVYYKRMDGELEISGFNDVDKIENHGWVKNILLLNLFGWVTRKGSVANGNSIVVVLLAVGLIGWACFLLVGSCEHISTQLEVNLFVVGFVVAAAASSFPDTLLSVKDAQKGKYMDAFSNAYGSNIFDICIGIGLPVLIYLQVNSMDGLTGIADANLILSSSFLLVVFTVLICLIYWVGNLKMWNALLVILLYFLFLYLVLYMSNHQLRLTDFF